MSDMKPAGSYATKKVLIAKNGKWREMNAFARPKPGEVEREVWTRDCGDWPYGKRFHPDREIACKGTGKILLVDSAMRNLVKARETIGRAFVIRSAYRSPEHNARTKGAAKHSQHMQGHAFDICIHNHDPFELIRVMMDECGFCGRGIYIEDSFIHFDLMPRTFKNTLEELKACMGPNGVVKEVPVHKPAGGSPFKKLFSWG